MSESFDKEVKKILDSAFNIMIEKHIGYGENDLDNKKGQETVAHKIKMNLSRIEKFLSGDLAEIKPDEITIQDSDGSPEPERIGPEIEFVYEGKVIKKVNLNRLFFEGVDDACIDIINYAVILLMIRRGHWSAKISEEYLKKFRGE